MDALAPDPTPSPVAGAARRAPAPLIAALLALAALATPAGAAGAGGADGVTLEVCQPEVFDPAALPEVCGLLPFAPVDGGAEAISILVHDGAAVGALALTAGPAGTLLFGGVLPDLGGSDVLRSIDDEAMWPCPPTVDDASARFAPVTFAAREARSTVVLANVQPGAAATPGTVMVVFVYADAPVRVTADCPAQPQALVADFALRAGWNVLASAAVEHEGTLAIALRPLTEDDLAVLAWEWQHTALLPEVAPQPSGTPPTDRRP